MKPSMDNAKDYLLEYKSKKGQPKWLGSLIETAVTNQNTK